jgi:MFS family permease
LEAGVDEIVIERKSPGKRKFRETSIAASSSSVKIPLSTWKVLAILSSIVTMTMYAETMLIPAIPDLIRDFHISYSMSSWLLTAYLITAAVMTPIVGKLSDIYSKKRVLLVMMIIYAVGVSAAGFATNIYLMLVARAIQGFGMAMFPIAFSIVREKFPREKMSIGNGVISSMTAAGAVIGLIIGGTIINYYGWQATFFTIIPIAIAILFTIWRYIPTDEQDSSSTRLAMKKRADKYPIIKEQEGNIPSTNITAGFSNDKSRHDQKRGNNAIDIIKGAITLAVAVTSFLLVLTFLNIHDNTNSNSAVSTTVVAGFVAIGISSMMLFIVVERRSKHPLIDFKLFLHAAILPSNLIILIAGFSLFMIFQTVAIMSRSPPPLGFGESAINVGYIQLPFALVFLIFGPTSGFIISKLGSIKPIIFGTIISTLGFFSFFVFHLTESSISVNLAILATGLSLSIVGVMNVVALSTPKQHSGTSLGTTLLMRVIGSAIGPAVAGMYMQMHQSLLNIHGVVKYFPSAESYNLIFLTGISLSVLAIVLAIVLRHRAIKMAIPNLV